MKKWQFIISCAFFGIVLNSCSTKKVKPTSAIDQLEWVLGNWQSFKEDSITFIENWHRETDFLSGTGFWVKNTDTIFTETLSIMLIDGTPYYVTTLPSKKKTHFKLNFNANGVAQFVNLQNEFPKRITYTKGRRDDLYIVLEDIPDKQGKFQEFWLKKR